MEVNPGFKHTDMGVIPEEWEGKSVSELAQIKTGPFGTLLKASEYSANEGVPLISVGEIGAGKFKITEHTPLAPNAVVHRLPQYVLRTGDIVFGRKGAVERSALVTENEDGWFLGSDGIAVRPRDGCDPRYLAAQFQSHKVQSWLRQNATGTTMASLNQEVLGRVQVPIAPLPEQRTIATTLSDVDALLGGLDQLIAKKRDLKQAAMQQLLTGQIRLPGFNGEWEVKTFGEVAAPRGDRIGPKWSSDHDFCVELEHIESESGQLLGSTGTSTQSSMKSAFRPGDVLFGKLRAYLRKYWRATRRGVCSTEIWVLVPQDAVTSGFLFQVIQTDDFIDAASNAYGTHMPRSDWNVVKNLKLKVPSVPEQTAIAQVLTDMDEELATLEERREKTRALKQAMMQELLTGKTRLV